MIFLRKIGVALAAEVVGLIAVIALALSFGLSAALAVFLVLILSAMAWEGRKLFIGSKRVSRESNDG